jgi:hypothetical protein
MANKIKESDLFEGDIFQQNRESSELLLKTLKELQAISKQKISLMNPESAKDIKDFGNEIEKNNMQRKIAEKAIEKQRLAEIKLQRDREKSFDNYEKKLQREEKSKKKQLTLYQQESKRLNELRNNYKDLVLSGKAYEKSTTDLLEEIQKLDKQLKDVDASVGQFQRNVGNYTEGVSDAIEKTGLFAGITEKLTTFVELFEGIQGVATAATTANTVATEVNTAAHVASTAALQTETVATEKLTLAKRVLNAVTSPLGLVIGATIAVVALLNAVKEVNQSLQDGLEIAKAFAQDKLWGTGELFQNVIRLTIKFRDEVRGLKLDLQALQQAEQDFTEISNDQTISLTERNKAFEEAVKLRGQVARAGLNIAQRELEIAQKTLQAEESRLGVGKGNARAEFYDKLTEATLNYNVALDELEDLERTNAQEGRQRFQARLIQEIELLRSNKLSANVRVAELKKSIADEKQQLEAREKFVDELAQKNKETQDEEFRLFQTGVEERINFADLIATKDEVQLANKIKTNIASIEGTELETTLAKIIKQAQDNQLENEANILKLKEERILRNQKIAQIERDILEQNRNEALAQIELQIKEKELIQEKNLQENLQNAFSIRANNIRRNNLKKLTDLEIQAIEKRKEDLDAQKENDKKRIEETIFDEQIKIKELEKINNQYRIDLDRLNAQILEDKAKADEKEIEQTRLVNNKKAEIVAETVGKIASIVNDELDKQTEKQQKALDQQAENREKSLEQQRERALQGLKSTVGEETLLLAKEQLKREQLERKAQQKRQLINDVDAFTQAYIANLKQPNANSTDALLKAGADIGKFKVLQTVIGGLFSALDGTEDTGQGGNLDKDGGFLAKLHPNERVLTKEQNAPLLKMGVKNADLPDLVALGVQAKNSFPNMMQSVRLNQTNKELVSEIRELKDIVKNKTEYRDFTDKHGNHVSSMIEKGMKRTITYTRSKPRI